MDVWQKHVYTKVSAFADSKFEYTDGPEVHIEINQREAYVVLKALEDQQRYLNPSVRVESNMPVNFDGLGE